MSYHVETVTQTRPTKMSTCNCFRSFVLYFVTLLVINNSRVNAFAIRKAYNATNESLKDLSVEESLQLEVKHDFKRPNDINENNNNKSNEISSTGFNENGTDVDVLTSVFPPFANTLWLTEMMYNRTNMNNITSPDLEEYASTISIINDDATLSLDVGPRETLTEISQDKKIAERILPQSLTKPKNGILPIKQNLASRSIQATVSGIPMTVSVDDINALITDISANKYQRTVSDGAIQSDQNKSMSIYTQSTTWPETENDTEILTPVSSEYNDTKSNLPSWKRYTVIDRKRVTATDESPISTEKGEDMFKAETRVTLEDSITTDKKDISSTTNMMSAFEYLSSTPNYQDVSVTKLTEILTKLDEVTTQKTKSELVSSKRAGFLNFSSKLKQIDATTATELDASDSISSGDYTTPILTTNQKQRSSPNINIDEESGSQSYLNEDAIKEELLQESSLKDNEETAQNRHQYRVGHFNNTDATLSTLELYSTNTPTSILESEWTPQTDITNTDYTFNVKPIQDKEKSTIVYAVNPNYKPMKKIEVLPPKPFVRDPDDNSWRNESISSLGIVFKPKNSSKPFTQVLKNKTETEWSNILSKESKDDVPDLRVRLEKIAQKRKSKKKKADLFGNIIYTDYEESNSSEEITSTQNIISVSTIVSLLEPTKNSVNQSVEASNALSTPIISTTPITSTTMTNVITTTEKNIEANVATTSVPTMQFENPSKNLSRTQGIPFHKKVKYESSTTDKGKKYFNVIDYYDVSDDDESEYLEFAKMELKKFTVPLHITDTPFATTPNIPYHFTKPLTQYLPERKPTIQYFPPRNIHQPKFNRFDNDFERRIKSNAMKTLPKNVFIATSTQAPDTPLDKYHSQYHEERNSLKSDHTLLPIELQSMYKPNELNKNLYLSDPPRVTTEQNNAYGDGVHNEGFNRASYVIKHYKDFLEQAAKDYDYDRDVDFISYTEAPLRGVTISDLIARAKDKVKTNLNENYDYDAKLRKDVLQRFVDNFNHNDARYNANFPVLYNNSVMHVNMAENSEAVTPSRAFLKGLYSPADTKFGYAHREPYDPNCDNVTVELSPAYELHYYVPEQEEKEEVEPKPVTLPLR